MTEPLILEPVSTADACVIWLHGLGANRYDFEPVGRLLQQRQPTIRFVFPQAPTKSVTVNGGLAMPSWYDILAMRPTARDISEPDIDAAAHSIRALIEAQVQAGIAKDRIVLAGFSQGGAVVLHTAYRSLPYAIGGAIALSTYGPTLNGDNPVTSACRQTPALFAHGTKDNVVTLPFGRLAHDCLQSQGIPVTWHTFDMDHEVTLVEVDTIDVWLRERLAQQ